MKNTASLTLLYDGACPVCALEMDHLRSRDAAGRLGFVDIAAPGFDPAPYGVCLAALHAEIHALRADGTMLRGVEVLRLAYDAAGLGWVLKPTGWPLLRPLFDAGYRVFARHRQRLSRMGEPLIRHLRERRARAMAGRMAVCRDRCETAAITPRRPS